MMEYVLDKERLIERRQALGISGGEAARRMKMSQPAYFRYETGARKPTPIIIKGMAQALETSFEYLTGKSNDPRPISLIVSKEKEPKLFRLVEICKSKPDEFQSRILDYAVQLVKEQNADR